jgi:hypothetical protein
MGTGTSVLPGIITVFSISCQNLRKLPELKEGGYGKNIR